MDDGPNLGDERGRGPLIVFVIFFIVAAICVAKRQLWGH